MLGKADDLIAQVPPDTRLRAGLRLLQDFFDGRFPELARRVASLKVGESDRIPVDGDDMFILIQCYEPRTREKGRFEAHKRYTDLQSLSAGQEWIEVCDARAQRGLPEFDANGNIYFPLADQARSCLRLSFGTVAVLFPNDAHAPCLRVEGTDHSLVRKVAVKIKDALWPESSPRQETLECEKPLRREEAVPARTRSARPLR